MHLHSIAVCSRNVVPKLGEAGSSNQPDISATDHRDFHSDELLRPRIIQRADAALADWVFRNAQRVPEIQCTPPVHDVFQVRIVDVANRAMEETRPYRAVHLNDCGHPGSIAFWRAGLRKPQVGCKVSANSP